MINERSIPEIAELQLPVSFCLMPFLEFITLRYKRIIFPRLGSHLYENNLNSLEDRRFRS